MKTLQASKQGVSCNHENNPILTRWEQLASDKKREAAVFAPDGRVLRTFLAVEEEATSWTERLADISAKVVCLQASNCAEWPALLIAVWRSGRSLLPMECEMPTAVRQDLEELCGVGLRLLPDKQRIDVVPNATLRLLPFGKAICSS